MCYKILTAQCPSPKRKHWRGKEIMNGLLQKVRIYWITQWTGALTDLMSVASQRKEKNIPDEVHHRPCTWSRWMKKISNRLACDGREGRTHRYRADHGITVFQATRRPVTRYQVHSVSKEEKILRTSPLCSCFRSLMAGARILFSWASVGSCGPGSTWSRTEDSITLAFHTRSNAWWHAIVISIGLEVSTYSEQSLRCACGVILGTFRTFTQVNFEVNTTWIMVV